MVTRDRSATPRDPLAMSCPLLWVRHTAAVLARKLLSESESYYLIQGGKYYLTQTERKKLHRGVTWKSVNNSARSSENFRHEK